MSRKASDWWFCIFCNQETDGLICYQCAENERNRQRGEPGSVTQKQTWYIERLVRNLDSQTTMSIIISVVPDYEGDFDSLSSFQAGSLIAKLLVLSEPEAESKP